MHQIAARFRSMYEQYNELNGRATAAAITLYGFLALFALAVLAVAIVGFISAGSSFAVAIGQAYDVAWRVPQRVARERVIGLGWLAGAAVLLGIAGFATAGLGALPGAFAPIVLLVSLAVNTLVWLWTSWILPNRRVPWRELLPAAVVGVIGLEILKLVGGYVVPQLVARSSALYGTIGVVFALLTWLLVLGRLAVFVTVVEVVEWERRHGTAEILVSGPALSDKANQR